MTKVGPAPPPIRYSPGSMRVLLFAYYFPPMGGIGSLRALGFARHLPAAGVDVSVIAPKTGSYGLDPSLAEPAGVRVVRTGSLEPAVLLGRGGRAGAPSGGPSATKGSSAGIKGRLRRLVHRVLYIPDANIGWVPKAIAAAKREAAAFPPDVVLSSSPPFSCHIAASITARKLGVPHVGDFRDFFSSQRLFGGLREKIDTRIENRVLGRIVDYTAATEGVREIVRTRARGRGMTILNGYDEEDFGPMLEVPPAREPFTFVHIGTTYAGRRDPRPFFRSVKTLATEGREFRVRFVGAPDPDLEAIAVEAGVADRCDFAGFTTHEAAVAEMRRAGALLLFLWAEDGSIAHGTVAGKTLEYLRAGRPILYLGPDVGETPDLLRELGGTLFARSDDVAVISSAMRALMDGQAPKPADPADLRPYSRCAQAARLAERLREVAE